MPIISSFYGIIIRMYFNDMEQHHKFYQILSDENLFKKISVNDGEVEWVTGQDFCPHTLWYEGGVCHKKITSER